MGGCVVPPGTAAMCQTSGEEERGREQAEERESAMEGGRGWKEREAERRKRKEEKDRERKGGGGGVPSAVSQNNIQEPLVCPFVQLWQGADN